MLEASDLTQLTRQLQCLYRASDLETFPSRVLEALGPLVGSEISCVTQVAPSRGWARNVSDRPDDDVEAVLPALAEFQHQHPRLIEYLEDGTETARAISDYVNCERWERTDLYNHFYRPLGLRDQICIVFPATTEIALSVVANRAGRTFTERDRRVLDALLPHVKTAYDNACAYEQVRRDGEAVAAVGRCAYLRISVDGRVLHAPPFARKLLCEYLPRDEQPDDRLRGALGAWVRDQLDAEAPADVRRAHEVRSPDGTLRLRLLAATSGEEWLLVLRHLPFQALTERDARVASLPERSRQVLERLLLGDSEKQVAARLEISRHTVHDHVKRIHRAFDVASRGELLATFLRIA